MKHAEITRMRLDELTPAPYNPRAISPEALAGLRASLERFGTVQPVIWNRQTGHVVGGHQRIKALQEMGDTETNVVVVDLPEIEEKALNVALNNPSIAGEFTVDIHALIAELIGELPDLAAALRLPDLSKLMADMLADLNHGTENTDPDAVPSAPSAPITQRGDLWILGDHRLMCGDSRESTDVDHLMNGQQINVGFTSPPYAEQREYDKTSGFVPIPPDQYVDWFRAIAENVKRFIAADGSWFVNIKPSSTGLDTSLYVMDLVIAHVREWGWHFATEFCWERNGVPKSVTQRFKNQFEPIYQFSVGRWKMNPSAVRHQSDNVPVAGGPGVGDTSWAGRQGGGGRMFGRKSNLTGGTMAGLQGTDETVIRNIGKGMAYPGNRLPTFASTHAATGHAAAFPVGLPDFFMRAFSDLGDSVFDPFCGSGSTIIAAEINGRVGFGMEISPVYCDVIVRRWEEFTGRQAVRIVREADWNADADPAVHA